jgi:uncharacterized protein (DUF58 family)
MATASRSRTAFTTRASCLIAAGCTAVACGLLLGIVDLARAGVLAVAVPLLSALVVLRSQVQLANRRTAEPPHAAAGDTVVVNLTISNRSLLPMGALMLEDQLPNQLSGNARFALDSLRSRETRTVSYRMPRLPRGHYRTGPLHIRLTDPFHLVDLRRSFTATNEVVVTPIVERLGHLEPPRSIDVGDDAGSHSIGVRGADDASTREYRTGDDLRKIHWRSSARTGALMVRQEERPWQGEVTLLLDLRTSAHVDVLSTDRGHDERLRSSLEWAVSAAASIGTYTILANRDVGLTCDLAAPGRVRMATADQLSNYLADVRGSARDDLTPFRGVVASLARESTVIAVLGDLDPESLHLLAEIHPRGSATTAMAIVLDTATWAYGLDAPPSPYDAPCFTTARVLSSAGWQVGIARCGDSVADVWRTLLAYRSVYASGRAGR